MGLFDRIKTTAGGVAGSVAKSAGQLAGKATVEAKEQAKILPVMAPSRESEPWMLAL